MEFQHPEFLYYMLVPLFILFGFLLTQRESQATFFSEDVMSKLRVSANTLTLKARNALFMLIGILILIALAGPVIPEGKVEIKAKSADIMVALDISDSMLAEDVYPNRLKLAKQKALELLKLAPNERIGVIAFAKNSYLVSPLSFDHDAVAFLLRQLNTDSITEKGTNFLSMLEVVDKSIKKESKKYLLILSDGGDEKDFSREIAYAKEKDIAVFVLGVGTKKGAPIKLSSGEFIKHKGDIIVSKLNADISTFATKTGGVYIEGVNSIKDVKTMLVEIEAHSEKKELKSQEVARFIPLFYFPLGLALLLLLVATSSMSKREKVYLPSVVLMAAFMTFSPQANAGILDFVDLDKAKSAYEKGEYKKSAVLYAEYAKKSKSGESYYNVGNALYKQGKYKEAQEAYQRATFEDETSRAKNFANLGNSYAKQRNKESLQKAVESYESSLKLQEDKETRENLEAVKKALEKQKQEEQKQEDQEQEDKNQENKENQENQDQEKQNKQNKEKNKQGEDKEDTKRDSQENQEENQKNEKQQKNDEKSEDMKSKEKEQESEQNADKNEENKEEKKEKQETQEESKQKQNEDKLQELKNDENQTQDSQSTSALQEKEPQEMSDKEEKKWLQRLNQNPNTYLYRLNAEDRQQENKNEKPW